MQHRNCKRHLLRDRSCHCIAIPGHRPLKELKPHQHKKSTDPPSNKKTRSYLRAVFWRPWPAPVPALIAAASLFACFVASSSSRTGQYSGQKSGRNLTQQIEARSQSKAYGADPPFEIHRNKGPVDSLLPHVAHLGQNVPHCGWRWPTLIRNEECQAEVFQAPLHVDLRNKGLTLHNHEQARNKPSQAPPSWLARPHPEP